MKRMATCFVLLTVLSFGSTLHLSAQDSASKSDSIEPDAIAALNRMGTYLRTLKEFQVEASITTEDVLDDGEKLQFAQKTNILARLPNKLRADVDGDLKSRIYLYDGKSFTMFARRAGFYATVPAPPTIGELIDNARDKYDLDLPMADLFLWGGPKSSVKEITSASDIGPGEVGGITCEHYSFRQPGLDWQVWIQLGDHPLPKKLVLVTTTDEARPQYSSVLTWNLAPSLNEESFVFDPPPEAHKIEFAKENAANK
jgi:hypothetical protein